MTDKKLILASGSPRRREILAGAGYDFRWISPKAEEVSKGLSPEELVAENARRKAQAALETEDGVILCADTVVCLEGEILGKPGEREAARKMLEKLSGKTHLVITGWILCDREKAVRGCEKCEVSMRRITEEELSGYLDTGSPLDKAGAYGIQDAGGMFVESISGDYYTVMGLPLCSVSKALREEFGILPFSHSTAE